jgi:hypothetical protein
MSIYVCCKCMFQMFHLFQTYVASVLSDVAYVAIVIHICCKRMFQLFHLVLVCCNRCSSLRALTRKQACIAPGALAPPGMVPHDRACIPAQHMCMYVVLLASLSCALGHSCCALSCIGGMRVVIPLSPCSWGLSRIRARTLCSLSY